MPRQNRVTPFGQIIVTAARGTLMGNRGCLHNETGRIKRLYQTKRWIICQLQFKDRQRTIMAPGKYTELFFLDEVTALAAGHRPCAECFRPKFNEFVATWMKANPTFVDGPKLPVAKLDAILHAERLINKEKVTYREQLARLPSGTFVTFEKKAQAYLVLEEMLLPWQPEGYGKPVTHAPDNIVSVLTPRSIVNTLAAGYTAHIHPSVYNTNPS